MRAPERARRLDAAYFDELYLRERDPWGFESSAYERRKYRHTLAAIGAPGRRVGRALEVGCSIGVFTELLAGRCDELMRFRQNVRVEQRELPEELPAGPWDLIVCSEVLYYWDAELLTQALPALVAELADGGSLLAVHWRPATRTYPLLGDEVHDLLARELDDLEHARSATRAQYRLDRWDRPG
jgi:SAM-dependent methyltransferase